ncbi:ATPase, T2SS/T4P/T4SS family [Paracoccus methylovorus]
MLRTALGPAIARFLEDCAVVEVMLNPDGRIWVDRLRDGLADTGQVLSASDGERIIRLVAHHVGVEVHGRSPRVSAELPETGERFEGLLPPVVAAPAFAIRKRPDRIPIGEVRGAEALDLLKAWGTGHPGGIGTIHAGSSIGALRRLEQLIQEAVITVPRALIAETVDLVAVLSGRGSNRCLTELVRVDGLGPDGDYRIASVIPDIDPHTAENTGETP